MTEAALLLLLTHITAAGFCYIGWRWWPVLFQRQDCGWCRSATKKLTDKQGKMSSQRKPGSDSQEADQTTK